MPSSSCRLPDLAMAFPLISQPTEDNGGRHDCHVRFCQTLGQMPESKKTGGCDFKDLMSIWVPLCFQLLQLEWYMMNYEIYSSTLVFIICFHFSNIIFMPTCGRRWTEFPGHGWMAASSCHQRPAWAKEI